MCDLTHKSSTTSVGVTGSKARVDRGEVVLETKQGIKNKVSIPLIDPVFRTLTKALEPFYVVYHPSEANRRKMIAFKLMHILVTIWVRLDTFVDPLFKDSKEL